MQTERISPPERAHLLAEQRTLVERARRGESAACRALYEAHVDRVFRLTYRMTGAEHRAKELTQDTFVRAFSNLDAFRGESSFGTWLHTIAVSVSLNDIRSHKRREKREAPLEAAQSVHGTSATSDPMLRARLERAIAELPEGCRTVFLMHDAEGFTHEEIAATLGVTPGTSKAQLSRGRAKLRVALADLAEEWKP